MAIFVCGAVALVMSAVDEIHCSIMIIHYWSL